MTELSEHEQVVMTPKGKTVNSTTLIIERRKINEANEKMHVAGGEHTGIIINKETAIENGDYTPPKLQLEFRVFLVNKETGKHTQESRTLRFWFRPSTVIINDEIDGDSQATTAQDFFRELVSPQEFPRDYVGFIKKIMKLMQHNYNSILKLEVELRQLEEAIDVPSRPLSAEDNSLGNIVVLTVEKVLEIIESSYPNPVTIKDIAKDNAWDEEEVAQCFSALQSRNLVKAMEHGAFTRQQSQHDTHQVTIVKQMPTMASNKQPTIAIITAQYCEKLAVDAMIENKETFVRYTTVDIPKRKHDDFVEDEANNKDLLEDNDPISNWVIEVDPVVLKEGNVKLSDDTLHSEKINKAFDLKYDHEFSSISSLTKNNFIEVNNENKLLMETAQSFNEVVQNKVDNLDLNDRTNTIHNVKKVNILSDWLLGENEAISINISPTNLDKQNYVEVGSCMNDGISRCETSKIFESSDHPLPLIVIPPKEAVAHLPLIDDFQIIIEGAAQNSENQNTEFIENNILCTSSDDSTVDSKFDTVYNNSSDTSEAKSLESTVFSETDILIQSPISIQLESSVRDIHCSEITSINSNNGIKAHHISKELVDSNDDEMIFKEDLNEASKTMNKTRRCSQLNEKEEGVETTKKKHYQDKKTYCFYCENDVTHFPRHLATWHEDEIEVQRILSYKSKSRERRNALSALGKRGNFVKNRSSLKLRPVKRVKSVAVSSTNDFLPCPHCLGFYKKKSLYRHSKQCSSRSELVNVTRQNAQSDGQTALLLGTLLKHDQLLKKELFPRMRADEITMTAKKDTLICNYASSYMKGRRSKGNLDLVRQNTRRLAKLLRYAKEENGEINELMDLLCPTMFQVIINGVNKIGGYNHETDTYESPTVAINFGTLIKKCCDLAYINLLQKPNTEGRRKELKILKVLVESQWANEVSAQAATNLNFKKWNKEELLPLTSDLKKLKNYLETTAEKMFKNLHTNEKDQSAYNTLKEVIYTQIILMNRRRPAEVSQLKVQTYKLINLNSQENELGSCLTETEKILLNSCSRIVIRGKRGRGVPILLSPKMREHFDFLVKIRNNFVKNNDFIFHTSGKSFIDGTQIVFKYAQKCGAENPKSISATRLRKHLATVTQLLQFSKNDLEQLSRFMGHTLKTHCDFYRLSDSMYQTAKISKLLLLATEGGLEKYNGMKLDEIDIDLSPIAEECDLEETISYKVGEDLHNDSASEIAPQTLIIARKQQNSGKKEFVPNSHGPLRRRKLFQNISKYILEANEHPNKMKLLNSCSNIQEYLKTENGHP